MIKRILLLIIVIMLALPQEGFSLRPIATSLSHYSETIFPIIEWVAVKSEGKSWFSKEERVDFMSGFEGTHTIIKRVKYKGKNFRAKMAYNAEEECYIISQALVLNYLNQLGISGIPKARHFLQIKIGKGLKRQLKSECGIVNPEEKAKVILFEELPEGRTLEDVTEKRPISEMEIVEITLKVAEILKPIHDAGVKHGDVRASNIWIPDKENNPILFDFDFSYKIGENKNSLDALSLVQMLALILTGEFNLASAIDKGRNNISVELLNILRHIEASQSKHDYLSVDEFIMYFSVFLEAKKSLNPSERKQEIGSSNTIIKQKTIRFTINSAA